MSLSQAAQRVADQLTLAKAVEPKRFPNDREAAERPGMYAWWADDEARAVLGEEICAGAPATSVCWLSGCDEVAIRYAVISDSGETHRTATHPRQRSVVHLQAHDLGVAAQSATVS